MNTFKKISALSLAVALGGLSFGAFAQSAPVSNGAGAYAGVKLGNSHWSDPSFSGSRDELGGGFQGGYRFALDSHQSIGPEIGYVHFGKLSASSSFGNATATGQAGTLGVSYVYSFNNPVYLTVRGGYERWKGNLHGTVYGVGSASGNAYGNGYYEGVGVGYNINKDAAVVASYDFHRSNGVFAPNDHVNNGLATVGVEYRF